MRDVLERFVAACDKQTYNRGEGFKVANREDDLRVLRAYGAITADEAAEGRRAIDRMVDRNQARQDAEASTRVERMAAK